MVDPKISIIIPTYNRKIMLQRAVQSVLAQEYKNWELVIIDDGSTDGTRQYIKKLDHDKILYKFQENKGRSSARNLGIDISNGSYICFLDSDDELLSNYLDAFRILIKDNEEGIYLAGVRLQSGVEYKTYLPQIERKKHLLQCLEGTFNLMPFCFCKSTIKNEPFQSDLYYGEDFHFLIPLIIKHNIHVVEDSTSIVHQHAERTINKVFLKIEQSYAQLENSVLKTIDQNATELEEIISKKEIKILRSKKVSDFILTAAKYNLGEAKKINNRQQENKLGSIVLIIQRIKGILQSWMI